MTKSERARARRAWLLAELGGRCCVCGRTDQLQCDLVKSDGGAHHKLSWADRQVEYVRQHMVGNVQLLCDCCHRVKTARDRRGVRVGLDGRPVVR